jgi:predicted ATPase
VITETELSEIELTIFGSEGASKESLPILWNSSDKKPCINVLIGPNGTYKSEILKAIAYHFAEKRPRKPAVLINSDSNNSLTASRVIAATNAVFDKFPRADTSFMHLKTSVLKSRSESNYYHFGAVANRRYFSARAMLFDSLASAMSALVAGRSGEPLLALFDFLNLDSFVELVFSLNDEEIAGTDIKGLEGKDELDAVLRIIRAPSFQKNLKRYAIPNHFVTKRDKRVIAIQLNFRRKQKIERELSEFLLGIEVLRRARKATLEDARLKFQNGRPFSLDAASSGQSSLMLLCLSIASVLEDNSLVLIDEPEIGLHPDWQHRFTSLLDKILSSTKGSRAIIATHSPSLVGNLPEGRSNVVGLRAINGRTVIRRVPVDAFGWSVDRILFDIFDVETVRNEVVSGHLKELMRIIADPEINTEKLGLSLKYLKQLKMPTADPLLRVIEEAENILRNSSGTD